MNHTATESIKKPEDLTWEGVKDRIYPELKKIEKGTGEEITQEFLDLEIAYYILEKEEENVRRIDKKCLEHWGVDKQQLFEKALQNQKKWIRMGKIEKILRNCFGYDLPKMKEETPFYVLTNKLIYKGAAVVLDTEALSIVRNIFGCDFFIIPSSIHEVIILPENLLNNEMTRDLQKILMEVNSEEVREEDRLSERTIYAYKEGKVKIAIK